MFRIPAFTAGLFVMLAFSAGVQGFFLIFAVWIQTGMGYSPLAAGLTALAFSAGSFLLASAAVPLAQRYGRWVLCCGGLLLAAGTGAIQIGAGHVGPGTDPWPVVPGLVLAGAGLSLLVIPLANVVLAAVPSQAAGGLFSTAQQLGGALGVAVIGTIFFGQLGTHSFTQAFTHGLPVAAGLFLASAALSLLLPKTAVADEHG